MTDEAFPEEAEDFLADDDGEPHGDDSAEAEARIAKAAAKHGWGSEAAEGV